MGWKHSQASGVTPSSKSKINHLTLVTVILHIQHVVDIIIWTSYVQKVVFLDIISEMLEHVEITWYVHTHLSNKLVMLALIKVSIMTLQYKLKCFPTLAPNGK